jgi:hypothetical protein
MGAELPRAAHRSGVYEVVRHIGDCSEADHLVVVWEELPGHDEVTWRLFCGTKSSMQRSGRVMAPSLFDDLDPELRRDREASGHTYSERPSERAANDAARHYVREYYGEDAVTKAAAVFPRGDAEEGARHRRRAPRSAPAAAARRPAQGCVRGRSRRTAVWPLRPGADSAPSRPSCRGDCL